MRFVKLPAIAVLLVCSGSQCDNLGLDIPDASRESVQFRIRFSIQHATEDLLESQSVTVTSWRKLSGTGQADEGSTIENRYTTADAIPSAEITVLRGYNFATGERIVFHVLSTGATTQASETFEYQLSQAHPDSFFSGGAKVIEETRIIYCEPTG
ncbi:MAG: hypothetical protein H6818_02980 [Phycisphaerales bacterium]|nr:hypothetical protein [Phycisphaerales bacterium]MCB9864655.1 hypothetical protein [Phycisphaerales bacterium]